MVNDIERWMAWYSEADSARARLCVCEWKIGVWVVSCLLGHRLDMLELTTNVLPQSAALAEVLQHVGELVQRNAHLQSRVSLAQRHGSILDRTEVDGDTERNTNLVGARVAATDRLADVIDLVRDVGLRQQANCTNGLE